MIISGNSVTESLCFYSFIIVFGFGFSIDFLFLLDYLYVWRASMVSGGECRRLLLQLDWIFWYGGNVPYSTFPVNQTGKPSSQMFNV